MKAQNVKGKIYINHDLNSDEELRDILAPWGITGFVTNFGVNSDSSPNQEPGRLICSCGYRDPKYSLGYNSNRSDITCPQCGGKISFISVPRAGRHSWRTQNTIAIAHLKRVDTPHDSKLIFEMSNVTFKGSEANGDVAENQFISIVRENSECFSLTKNAAGNITISHNAFNIKSANLNSLRSDDMRQIFDFWPVLKDVIMAQGFPSDDSMVSRISYALHGLDGFVKWMYGIQKLPNIYNSKSVKNHFEVINKFTESMNIIGEFVNKDGHEFAPATTVDALYDYFNLSYWPNPDILLKNDNGSLFKIVSEMKPETWANIKDTTIFKWAYNRFMHGESAHRFQSMLTYIVCHTEGTKDSRYNSASEVYEFWDEFCEFAIQNYDQYDEIAYEFRKRIETIREKSSATIITSDILRNREFFPLINVGKYKALKGTDVEAMIAEDPLGLIERLRRR